MFENTENQCSKENWNQHSKLSTLKWAFETFIIEINIRNIQHWNQYSRHSTLKPKFETFNSEINIRNIQNWNNYSRHWTLKSTYETFNVEINIQDIEHCNQHQRHHIGLANTPLCIWQQRDLGMISWSSTFDYSGA